MTNILYLSFCVEKMGIYLDLDLLGKRIYGLVFNILYLCIPTDKTQQCLFPHDLTNMVL